MSKRLKRKIRDMYGLDALSKEQRRAKATEILNDNNIKQKMCNACPGLTFKDIERAMRAILAERQKTDEEVEEETLRTIVPEKFEPQPYGSPKRKSGEKYKVLSPEETRELVQASSKPFDIEWIAEPIDPKRYKTYTEEEVQDLIDGCYNPYRRKLYPKKS